MLHENCPCVKVIGPNNKGTVQTNNTQVEQVDHYAMVLWEGGR